MMLEQLQAEPGHRVLEIGSGGYNASLYPGEIGSDPPSSEDQVLRGTAV